MQEKKSSTKNQHFVPQFYLRNFTSDEKNIGAYVIKRKKYIHSAPIKNLASEDYFYSADIRIENSLTSLEGIGAGSIKKILSNPYAVQSEYDVNVIFLFLIIQIARTPTFVNNMNNSFNHSGRMILKQYIEGLKKIGKDKEVEVIYDDFINKLSFSVEEPGRYALSLVPDLLNILSDIKSSWKFLINKTNRPFITSDNPACTYNQHFERIGGLNFGLGCCGIQLYLPLSSKIGIIFYDNKCYKIGNRNSKYVEIFQVQDIYQLNKLVACHANEILLFNSREIGSSDIEKLAKDHDKYFIQDPIIPFIVNDNSNGTIFGNHHKSMYCKMQLSFVKELIKYLDRDGEFYQFVGNRMRSTNR